MDILLWNVLIGTKFWICHFPTQIFFASQPDHPYWIWPFSWLHTDRPYSTGQYSWGPLSSWHPDLILSMIFQACRPSRKWSGWPKLRKRQRRRWRWRRHRRRRRHQDREEARRETWPIRFQIQTKCPNPLRKLRETRLKKWSKGNNRTCPEKQLRNPVAAAAETEPQNPGKPIPKKSIRSKPFPGMSIPGQPLRVRLQKSSRPGKKYPVPENQNRNGKIRATGTWRRPTWTRRTREARLRFMSPAARWETRVLLLVAHIFPENKLFIQKDSLPAFSYENERSCNEPNVWQIFTRNLCRVIKWLIIIGQKCVSPPFSPIFEELALKKDFHSNLSHEGKWVLEKQYGLAFSFFSRNVSILPECVSVFTFSFSLS